LRLITLAAGIAGALVMSTAKAAPELFDKSAWVRTPGLDDILAAYPLEALGVARAGVVGLSCTASAIGSLEKCSVSSEIPADAGFGKAALALAPRFTATPLMAGKPVEIRLPFNFHAWLDQEDVHPDWVNKPTYNQIMSAYPTEAYRNGQSGSTILVCIVTVEGRLRGCRPTRETPPSLGFGPAASIISSQFLMRSAKLRGQPVESIVRIPITFTMPGGEKGGAPVGMQKTITKIDWQVAPSVADVSAAYPKKARGARIDGRVALACTIGPKGGLVGCQVTAETPTGKGFVEAAFKLSRQFVAPTVDAKGVSTAGAAMVLPFTFSEKMLSEAEPAITKVEWLGAPTADEIDALKPPQARAAGVVRGRVVMNCAVQATGTFDSCRMMSEEPAGMGIGAATLQLAPKFRIRTWTDDGLPVVGGRVAVPLRLEFGEPAPSQPPG
jgi:hypothetical protein